MPRLPRHRRIKESRKESTSSGSALSGVGLTPGTSFMVEVQQSLAYYIAQRVTSPRYQHLQFELSGADVKVCINHVTQECTAFAAMDRSYRVLIFRLMLAWFIASMSM